MAASPTAVNTLLRIDPVAETERIAHWVRDVVVNQFKRKGVVVGVSGGIDSSVVAALCTYALGKDRVFAIFMPEADSSDDSLMLGRKLTEKLGIRSVLENTTPILEAAGCYRRRDEAIRSVVPEYGEGYKSKIVLPNLLDEDQYSIFSLVVQSPNGERKKLRLPLNAYLGILAATNFKQRTRKMLEYYHADRLNFAVGGTPNRLEYDLGFFVKNGDGAADIKPIAHLYKSQVYQLAAHLGVPEEIQRRPPTTDTYSLAQSQEEFYFSMPLAKMDLCLYGKDHGMSPEQLAPVADLTADQVRRAYASIDTKRKAARYLRQAPVVLEALS
jgi:NAD+ synthase